MATNSAPNVSTFTPGTRVRVTQQMPRLGSGGAALVTSVEGVVVSFQQMKTGSWFAHSKDHKLWLDRVQLRKDDGEIVFLNLDRYSSVESL